MIHGDYNGDTIDITIDEFAREGVPPITNYFSDRLVKEADRHGYPPWIQHKFIQTVLDKI